jgi:predicted glutamine amidotransferase
MIAAVGRFRMTDLALALRLMASNANSAHDHEFRSGGSSFVHDCGWGEAHLVDGRLEVLVSAGSCLEDPGFFELGQIETGMAMLHARRTPDRATIGATNSHPFLVEYGGTRWAFCHNGALEDLSQLSSDRTLVPSGSTDSELLFHHVLTRLDAGRREASLAEIMVGLSRFTCLNCFLATAARLTVYTRAAPDTSRPRYYTLWRGVGQGLALASSEPVSWPSVSWEPVPDGESFVLEAPGRLNIDS